MFIYLFFIICSIIIQLIVYFILLRIIFIFCLFILFKSLASLLLLFVQFARIILFIVSHSEEHPTGLQSCPIVCSPKRSYMRDIFFSHFGYIGWKPGRKFRSRIRMDGSAVCTRDITPRTKTGLSVDPHLCHVWLISLLSI